MVDFGNNVNMPAMFCYYRKSCRQTKPGAVCASRKIWIEDFMKMFFFDAVPAIFERYFYIIPEFQEIYIVFTEPEVFDMDR